jgi:hypothetical protein
MKSESYFHAPIFFQQIRLVFYLFFTFATRLHNIDSYSRNMIHKRTILFDHIINSKAISKMALSHLLAFHNCSFQKKLD